VTTGEGRRRDSRVALALLGTTVFFWGTAFWPVGIAVETTTALMLSAIRTAPAALVLLAAVPLLSASLPRGRLLVWAVGTGLIMVTLFQWGSAELWGPLVWIGPVNATGVLLFYLALARLPAARASAALFLVPATAVIVEIARGSAPAAVVLVGMVLAVAGVALVNLPPERQERLRAAVAAARVSSRF
jgi:drug/metabolite transporter (DMT)-like permease